MGDLELLKKNYTEVENFMNELKLEVNNLVSDISNITGLLEGNINFIKKMQSDINSKAIVLDNYLDKNSANNGRLHDTQILKNLKITEVIILSIIIILILFIYMKKK